MTRLLLLLLSAAFSTQIRPDTPYRSSRLLAEEDIPSTFQRLFAAQQGPVTVDLYGQELVLGGESKFRTVILDRSGEEFLDRFLAAQGVQSESRESIVQQLMRGIESSDQCQGLIADCILYPKEYDFSYDEKTRRLKIFINEENIDFDRASDFYAIGGHTVAMVNQSALYAQKSKTSFTTDWRNDTSLSLPLGYIRADTTLTLSDQQRRFEVYDANYVLDRQGYSLSLGYQNITQMQNSAFALTQGQNASALHATAFSNQRLANRTTDRFGSLSVFVPESTDLEIMRDGESLYRGIVPQGLNKISLATFPEGSYNVDILFWVGGRVVKQEIRYVYNIPVFTMARGDYDWFAVAGQLQDNSFGNFYYAKAAINGRFLDTMLTGLGYINVQGMSVLSGYLEFVPNTYLHSSLTATAGLDGSAFLSGQINLFGFYVNGEWMHSDSEKFHSLFNSASFRLINAGWSFALLGGHFNISYNEYINDGAPGEMPVSARSIFFNGSRNFSWLRLSGTAQYNPKITRGTDNEQQEQQSGWYFSLNLEIPFDHITLASNYSHFDNNQSSWRNTVRGQMHFGPQTAVNGELTVGLDHIGDDKKVVPSGLLAANHSSDYLTANGNLYLDRLDGYNASVALQSTQLVNSDTFVFTAGNGSESYLLLRNVSAVDGKLLALEQEDDVAIGNLELRNKSVDGMSVIELDRPSQVIPLEDYCQYQAKINDKGGRFIATREIKLDYFTKPGTFVKIVNPVAQVDQYIVSFSSERGLVNDLSCDGPGCAGLNPITKGVYRLSLFNQQRFELYAGTDICLLPAKDLTYVDEAVNLGRSVCLNRETLSRLLADAPKNYRLYYLGVSKSVDRRLAPNTTYVRVGDVYARFQYARDSSFRFGDFVPRAVRLPANTQRR